MQVRLPMREKLSSEFSYHKNCPCFDLGPNGLELYHIQPSGLLTTM